MTDARLRSLERRADADDDARREWLTLRDRARDVLLPARLPGKPDCNRCEGQGAFRLVTPGYETRLHPRDIVSFALPITCACTNDVDADRRYRHTHERSCAARERARVLRILERAIGQYEEVVANTRNQQDMITSIVSRETCMQIQIRRLVREIRRLVRDGHAFGEATRPGWGCREKTWTRYVTALRAADVARDEGASGARWRRIWSDVDKAAEAIERADRRFARAAGVVR